MFYKGWSSFHPECLVLVTGDFNPTSTNIAPTPFKRSCGLTQIINVLTRDSGILDWCLTNKPKALCAPSQLPKLGSSDHYCVLIKQGLRGKTTKQTITRRDTRASCIRAFGSWITTFSWDALFALDSCKDKFDFSFRLCLLQLIDTSHRSITYAQYWETLVDI